MRAVDPVQFDQRRLGYEFDMLQNRWDQSLSPGNEQAFYWGSEAADIPGTRNYMGAKDPAIDAMIAAILEARERPAFVSAVRALDRVLMSGFYAIPLFNVQEQWIARWNRIERPADHRVDGLFAGNLVAEAEPRNPMQASNRNRSDAVTQPNASPTLDTLFQTHPGAAAGCAGAGRSPQQAARHRPGAEATDLCAGRPRDFGAGRAFHRIRTAGEFGDRGATAEHDRIRAHGAGRLSRRPRGRGAAAVVAAGGTDRGAQPHRRARAIVTASRIDGIVHADIAMNAAAEAFSIRHVCGFGADLPEGMASLDNAIMRESTTARAVIQDGRKAALISFDVTTDGFRAVPRTHLSLIAGGLALSLESDVPQGATMLSAFSPMSFAGLASSLAVWLLSGGTLVLHHPFDEEVLEQQINAARLRHAGCAGATGVAARRTRPRRAPAELAQRHRPVARAGTGRLERVLGSPNRRR